jgi:predicted negative regulator of RcsB-dependent stress response
MEIYESEEQRVEALVKWWKTYSNSVFMGLALGLALLTGWNVWQNTQKQKAQEAAGLYQQLLKAVEAKQPEPAIKLSERIIEQHQGSVYATYATLFSARLKAESGDLAGAKKALGDLLASSQDENIQLLARLRLAQVLQALGEADPALKLLEPMKPRDLGKYESRYEELKGDLYAAQQRDSEALAAYEQAKQSGDTAPLLEMKINNLGVAATSPAEAKASPK